MSDPSPLLFAFRRGELLLRESGAGLEIPDDSALDGGEQVLAEERFASPAGVACRAVALPDEAQAPSGMRFVPLRRTHGHIPDDLFALAGRASQLLEWNRAHRFCGRCGERTRASGSHELAKECPGCGGLSFPRLSPAVIVAVRDGERLLLARGPHFPPGMYSTLAGFVEPGESLEEAVAREVREEAGVEVSNVRYFGSQPWPFPHSLMIGFTADYAGGELRPEPAELEDAGWYRVGEMPLVPPPLSIARALVEWFVVQCGGDPGTLRTVL